MGEKNPKPAHLIYGFEKVKAGGNREAESAGPHLAVLAAEERAVSQSLPLWPQHGTELPWDLSRVYTGK